MINGSTQRHSYPFDKMIPVEPLNKFNSVAKQVEKKMHKKKQRQHNRKISTNNHE